MTAHEEQQCPNPQCDWKGLRYKGRYCPICGERLAGGPEGTTGLPTAPPTRPVLSAKPAARSSWPAVIGIIGIVLGALSSVQGLWGALSPLWMPALMSLVPQQQGLPLTQMTQQWQAWTVISSLVTVGLGVLLLVVGIGLVKRRLWGISAGRAWAMLKIPWVIVGSIFGYMVAKENFDTMARQGPVAMSPMPGAFSELMLIFSVVLGLVWGWALPVFLLIWFSRHRVKDEVAQWA